MTATALQLAGVVLVVTGVALLSIPVAVVVGGLAIFALGFILEKRPTPPEG